MNLEGVPATSAKVRGQVLESWDVALADRWQQKLRAYWERRNQAYKDRQVQANAEWWRRYNDHLASDRWRELRRLVMARCHGTCEGCGERPAVQIHHLTYERLGNEMLFDLVAVCMTCHETIHNRPIGQAGGGGMIG
jgi:5-methylcytosine-specific restriction endonuclease McrA